MEIVTGITRVHAAKTSGECRKRIADASHALGLASANRAEAVKLAALMDSSGQFTPESIEKLTAAQSDYIRDREAEAFKALKSVLGAVVKSLENIEKLPAPEMLEKTREAFELAEAFIPQTEK